MKKKVKNTVHKKKGITNTLAPKTPSNTLSFDFSYPGWLKSINNKEFNNRLQGESQFARCIFEVLNKIFPIVQVNWDNIKTNQKKQFPHCHTLAKDKIELVEKIVEDIHGRTFFDQDTDESLKYWQLGLSQSIRVITVYDQNKNVMYPVFIDYHHLIHESIKFNQKDYDQFPFCPFCEYAKTHAYS